MSNNHRNLILSCAASDDDPLEQGLGVAQVDDGDAICYGEMGGGQMHGLGRIQSSLITYIGFLERDLYHGPGLLIDHEEKSRCEGVFTLGQLSEGKSTSPFIDRDGKRQDGGLLDGRGLKVMRDAENRVKVHRGNFVNDELDGRASVWTLVDSPEKSLELEQRLEAKFHQGQAIFGRAYIRDKLAYLGGLDHRERRKGLGFTITKNGKAILVERDGERTIGEGIIADLSAYTYRRVQGGSTSDPSHAEQASSPTAAAASSAANEIRVDPRASAYAAPQLPSFWDEDGILNLFHQVLADPAGNWNAMILLMKALRGEQTRLWREEVPSVAIASYSEPDPEKPADVGPLPVGLYRGDRCDNLRHGHGVGLLYPSGDIYRGEWNRDVPEGHGTLVRIQERDVFCGEIREGLWIHGTWSLLTGWRVEGSFYEPQVPQGVVTVWSPEPHRTKIEAYYRMRAVGCRRDDADVRITSGPPGSRSIFRGSVYSSDGILVIPKPRMGLEYREKEDATYELQYDEAGNLNGNRVTVIRNDKDDTIYRGEMVDGLAHGEGTEFHSSSRPQWLVEGQFAHGKPHGRAHRTTHTCESVYLVEFDHGVEKRIISVGQRVDERLLKEFQNFQRILVKGDRDWKIKLHGPFEAGIAGAETGDPAQMVTKGAIPNLAHGMGGEKSLPSGKAEGKKAHHHHQLLALTTTAQAHPVGGQQQPPSSNVKEVPLPALDKGNRLETKHTKKLTTPKNSGSNKMQNGGAQNQQKRYDDDYIDKSAGDLRDHPLVRPPVVPPPLVIPEMKQKHRFEDTAESAQSGDFQLVKPKKTPKAKAANSTGATSAAWAGKPGAAANHVKAQGNKRGPPPGVRPVEVLCIVEAGWQAGHVRILVRHDEDVNILGYKVAVTRTERPAKEHKAVESARNEFPIMGLTNGIKYNFTPLVRLEYKGYSWLATGATVRTSPPGPIKSRPKDLSQPFLRKMNDKGELMPNDDDGYWQWARYVSGQELSSALPPMKTYALKARVEEGDGSLAVEMDLAKEVQIHAEVLTIWVHPAQEPGLVSAGLRASMPYMEGEPFRAKVEGLTNGKLYNIAFQLRLAEGTYPSDEGIIILPGVPDASAIAQSEDPRLIRREQAMHQQRPQHLLYQHIKSPSVESVSVSSSIGGRESRSLSGDWKTPPTLPLGTDENDWPSLSGKPVPKPPQQQLQQQATSPATPAPSAGTQEGEGALSSVPDVLPMQLPPPAIPSFGSTRTTFGPPPGLEVDSLPSHSPQVTPKQSPSARLFGEGGGVTPSPFAAGLGLTTETSQGINNQPAGTINFLPVIMEGQDTDVDNLFNDVNIGLNLLEQHSLAEARAEEDRQRERKHVFLFQRQAKADPEYTGSLAGVAIGPPQQGGGEGQDSFKTEILTGTTTFTQNSFADFLGTTTSASSSIASTMMTTTPTTDASVVSPSLSSSAGSIMFGRSLGFGLPSLDTSNNNNNESSRVSTGPQLQQQQQAQPQEGGGGGVSSGPPTPSSATAHAQQVYFHENVKMGPQSSTMTSSYALSSADTGGGMIGTSTKALRFIQRSDVLDVGVETQTSNNSPEPYSMSSGSSSATSRTTPSPPVADNRSMSFYQRPISPGTSSSSLQGRNLSPPSHPRVTGSPGLGGIGGGGGVGPAQQQQQAQQQHSPRPRAAPLPILHGPYAPAPVAPPHLYYYAYAPAPPPHPTPGYAYQIPPPPPPPPGYQGYPPPPPHPSQAGYHSSAHGFHPHSASQAYPFHGYPPPHHPHH